MIWIEIVCILFVVAAIAGAGFWIGMLYQDTQHIKREQKRIWREMGFR